MLQQVLTKLVDHRHLESCEAEAALDEIMAGEATEAQIGGLLVALRMKGETAAEIAGFARAMRGRCMTVSPMVQGVVDTCGTGGDKLDTFNISTTAAFIACAAGVPIAKHGNRAVSSQCGSADVLTALGVEISLSPLAVGRCIDEVGIGFMFAAELHPAMKHAVGPRKQLAMRTVFNLLGPLTNPAGARRQVIGVYDAAFAPLMAEALAANGSEHVLIVHGLAGLDEIALEGPTQVTELKDGEIRSYRITAADLGLCEAPAGEITGGDATASARYLLDVLEGKRGARREIALANAAAGVYVGGKAGSLAEGVFIAREALDSGAALERLEALRKLSTTLA
ncbi:MAG: anthranilate phosphoribosyltransferase [Armatimonadota bacterium]